MRFNRINKRTLVIVAVFVAALITEFFFLEGTMGVSLPSDRYAARSTAKVTVRGLEPHFVTHNQRFSVVNLLMQGGRTSEALVLRETFFKDYAPDLEGPGHSFVTVEAMVDGRVRWSFQEAGERGEAYDLVYRVTKPGCCDAPPTFTYFSLLNGSKLRTVNHELSSSELGDLELSIAK